MHLVWMASVRVTGRCVRVGKRCQVSPNGPFPASEVVFKTEFASLAAQENNTKCYPSMCGSQLPLQV